MEMKPITNTAEYFQTKQLVERLRFSEKHNPNGIDEREKKLLIDFRKELAYYEDMSDFRKKKEYNDWTEKII